MRPTNFILSIPRKIYNEKYLDSLNLIDRNNTKYIPGSVLEKYRGKINPHEGFTGFTLLFHFKVWLKNYNLLFGYSNKRYVLYLFQDMNDGRNLFRQRVVVHDLNKLHDMIIELAGGMEYQDTTYLSMVVGGIYDIIAALPSNKYRYVLLNNHIPCTSIGDIGIPYQCSGRTIYSDSPELLADLLSSSSKLVLDESAFKEHEQILNRYQRNYNSKITYGHHNDVRFIATKCPDKYPGYASIALNTLERLDEYSDIDLLVKNFEKIVNPSVATIEKILLHYSNCGKPGIGLHAVTYAQEHNIESELIVATSYTILYHGLGKSFAEQRVTIWLINNQNIDPKLWTNNWQWYSDALKLLLQHRYPPFVTM